MALEARNDLIDRVGRCLLSFRCIADGSSAVLNRVMRLVGVEYIALAFLRDLPEMLSKGGTLKLLL